LSLITKNTLRGNLPLQMMHHVEFGFSSRFPACSMGSLLLCCVAVVLNPRWGVSRW
jgi:hypothetical protein